jgi:hypothetical protein
MVQGVDSDTQYPRNLIDEDFDETSLELPPARPATERTPMSYTLCKGRIIEVFGKIAVLANRISLPLYHEVTELDGRLDQAFAKVPSFLRLVPLEYAIADPVDLIVQRFNVALLYQKSRCVLHRKHLLKERENREYAYSKKIGLDASFEILRYQLVINEAIKPGGRLSQEKWFLGSLSMHDFLLAATIVYLNAIQSIIVDGKSPKNDVSLSHMIDTLDTSHIVWSQTSEVIKDSKKALDILGLMLKKIRLALGADSINKVTADGRIERGLISGLSLDGMLPLFITHRC